jgi:hypothetical protein
MAVELGWQELLSMPRFFQVLLIVSSEAVAILIDPFLIFVFSIKQHVKKLLLLKFSLILCTLPVTKGKVM